MTLVPGVLIPPPPAAKRRNGLLNVVGPKPMPRHGAAGGLRYLPHDCAPAAYALPVGCHDPGEAPQKPIEDGGAEEISTGVFQLVSTLRCSPVGNPLAEHRDQVARNLVAAEQTTLERTLWTGLDYIGAPLGTISLDSAATPVTGLYDPGDLRSVLGALLTDAALTYPYIPVLLAPASAESYAAELGMVVADGNALRTPTGVPWIFGAFPAGEIIIAGRVSLWRSELEIVDAFDNTSNQRLLIAERAYAFAVDCGFARRASFDPDGS